MERDSFEFCFKDYAILTDSNGPGLGVNSEPVASCFLLRLDLIVSDFGVFG